MRTRVRSGGAGRVVLVVARARVVVVTRVVGGGLVGATEVFDAVPDEPLLHAASTTIPSARQIGRIRRRLRLDRSPVAAPRPRAPRALRVVARMMRVVKYVVFIPDGCADVPLAELGDRTPLEAARMPRLAALAARSEVGRAEVIPPGLPPGSDVGNMSILGFDPARYHTGRAPIEAAAMGVELAPGEVAFRCNLVTLSDDATPVMIDFAAGHPTNEQSHAIVAALDAALGGGRDGVRLHPGVEYRHLCVVPDTWTDAVCTPPHDLTGQTAVFPTGASAARLNALMDASREVVHNAARTVGSSATQIWLWGQGVKPALPSFAATYGLEGRMTSAVDLVQGLGVLTGIDVVDVPGATAGFDNDYAAQARACIRSLDDRDLFVVHIEATDEAGHQGRSDIKVDALERWDTDVIGPVLDALDAGSEPYRILLLPDHATPCTTQTHSADSVPYLLFDSERSGAGGRYSEPATATCAPVAGYALMGRLVGA
jgi:2,3-bisphosphoglycerate-independent phosphoglycerate mutase